MNQFAFLYPRPLCLGYIHIIVSNHLLVFHFLSQCYGVSPPGISAPPRIASFCFLSVECEVFPHQYTTYKVADHGHGLPGRVIFRCENKVTIALPTGIDHFIVETNMLIISVKNIIGNVIGNITVTPPFNVDTISSFVSIKGGDEMKIRNRKKKLAPLRGASVSEAFPYRGLKSYLNKSRGDKCCVNKSRVNAKTW